MDGEMGPHGTVRESLIEDFVGSGLVAVGADVMIESVEVRDGVLDLNGRAAYGIFIEPDVDTGIPSNAMIRGSLVERCGEAGVAIMAANVSIESSAVCHTAPNNIDQFGDGVVVAHHPDASPPVVQLSSVRIESSARAGLSNFGGTVDLRDTKIQCSAFDLEGETFLEPFTFNDLGGNTCGCPKAQDACEVVSASLAPPPPRD